MSKRALFCASVIPLTVAISACGEHRLDDFIHAKNLRRHLEALDAIGKQNAGTRESASSGHLQSLAYVKHQLGHKYTVYEDEFQFKKFVQLSDPHFESLDPFPKGYVLDTDYVMMTYSGSGDVTASVVAVDVVMPPSSTPGSTSGCEFEDYLDMSGTSLVAGKIALIQRGSCTFAVKVLNAQTAGALGVVIYNEGQPGRTDALAGTLGADDEFTVPAIGASFAVGEELYNHSRESSLQVRLRTETQVRNATGRNLIAESRHGDPNSVVMMGAHLDSVQEGVGINDNGSGSAAILEIARSLHPSPHLMNKVRFAWWDAEEDGLIGSIDYTGRLTPEEVTKIKLYINLDMLASPNYGHFVYDSVGLPEGSKAIEELLSYYFVERHSPFELEDATGGRSDHAGFIDLGIPSGGLFTGAEGIKTETQVGLYGGTAGVAYDVCYHKACDDLSNVNWGAFERMSKAAAYAFGQLAMGDTRLGAEATTAQGALRDRAESPQSPWRSRDRRGYLLTR